MQPISDEEIDRIRKEFPALQRWTYFATNGLGVLPLRTVVALRERTEELARNAVVATLFRNPALVTETRELAARFLGADPEEIAFSRNTSEGVLWAASSLRFEPGDEVLVLQGEYPATVLPWLARSGRGVVTRFLHARDRRLTPDMVAEAWSPRTRLLSLSWVQFNSGFCADLAGMARVVHERGGLLLCDAIQGLGALRLDVREAGVDFLASGTQKWLLGLQGLGLFFCPKALLAKLEVTHLGTGSLLRDEDPHDPEAPYDSNFLGDVRCFEEGTRNYLGIAALRQSLRLFEEIGSERIEARVKDLTDYLVSEAKTRGCRIESPRGPGEWSGIVLFAPPTNGPPAAELVARMHKQRININAREGCIHMGVHFYNTREEIDRVLAMVGGR